MFVKRAQKPIYTLLKSLTLFIHFNTSLILFIIFLKTKNGSFVGDFASLFLPTKLKCEFKKKTKVNFSLLLLPLLSKPIYSWFSFALGFRGFHFLAHLL